MKREKAKAGGLSATDRKADLETLEFAVEASASLRILLKRRPTADELTIFTAGFVHGVIASTHASP